MIYMGPERRIYKVFVTRNSEYHMRRNTCVAIRDRKSGEWKRHHRALRQNLAGSILFEEDGNIRVSPGLPRVGESMYFEVGGIDLVTSSIVSVERSKMELISKYAA